MRSALELYDSRVSRIELSDGIAIVHFSHAYIHKSQGTPGKDPGTGWSREAQLILCETSVSAPLPPLPDTIAEGFLEVGGIRHEFVPLPFKRKVAAKLCLTFVNGAQIEIAGSRPSIELLGKAIYLEDIA